jgi:hypothetical protein
VEIDEAGLMLVEEAVIVFDEQLRALRERDQAAWEQAFARLAEAQEGA